MEISGTAGALMRDKSPVITTVAPDSMVFDAIQAMAQNNIGALPVVQGERLLGIVTERDYTRKVILKGKASKSTRVDEIMTSEPVTVSPDETVGECMRLMTGKRVRHLPVIENEKIVGILSMGDLVRWIISAQESTIDQLTKYVFGE